MSDELKSIQNYRQALQKELATGNTTEHTHRPALKTLIESLVPGVIATNEPGRIKCGAPDFVVSKGVTTIGYIEVKDIGKNLDEAEKTEQVARYRESLNNLILTNYLEFRWYVDGEPRLVAHLGAPTKEGKVKRDKAEYKKLRARESLTKTPARTRIDYQSMAPKLSAKRQNYGSFGPGKTQEKREGFPGCTC